MDPEKAFDCVAWSILWEVLQEINKRTGAAVAVMQTLYRSIVVKRELSVKPKLSIYWSLYIPSLTDGH